MNKTPLGRDDHIGLYCVELRTENWPAMVTWYRNVIGLRVLIRDTDHGYALLEAGDTRIALLARDQSGPASPRWSLGFEVENLMAIHKRVRQAGTETTATDIHDEGFSEFVTHDPDGNTIRLFAWPEHHA